VLLAFELAERQMVEHGWHPPLNFVVIGGGPTGVELAGAISDIAQLYMRHDFRHIDPAKSRVILLEGGPRVLAAYPGPFRQGRSRAQTLGVEVHTNTQVTGVGPGWVEAVAASAFDSVVTLWAAGVQASPLGKLLGAPTRPRGCVLVDDTPQPPGHARVFVLGDLAHFEQDGHQVPGVAQPAMQMGDHVAKMIAADLAGRRAPAFRYFDKGDMATIGRMDRRRQSRMALQSPHERLSRLGHLAHRPHLLSSSASATGSPSSPPGSGPTSPSPAARASSPATSASPAGSLVNCHRAMLDLGFVRLANRANLELVEEKLRARGADPAALLGDFRALDQSRREAITTSEQAQGAAQRAEPAGGRAEEGRPGRDRGDGRDPRPQGQARRAGPRPPRARRAVAPGAGRHPNLTRDEVPAANPKPTTSPSRPGARSPFRL
jgi:hypothetical protein